MCKTSYAIAVGDSALQIYLFQETLSRLKDTPFWEWAAQENLLGSVQRVTSYAEVAQLLVSSCLEDTQLLERAAQIDAVDWEKMPPHLQFAALELQDTLQQLQAATQRLRAVADAVAGFSQTCKNGKVDINVKLAALTLFTQAI